jgi:uncharacterized membrane protein (UPF0136 family)
MDVMQIQNSVHWRRFSTGQAFAGTGVIILCAFAIRYLIHPWIEPYAVFHAFTLGCLLIGFLFGHWFALLGMVLSVFLAEYFFVAPYGTFDGFQHKDFILSFNFGVITGAAIFFIEKLQRSLYAQGLVLKVMSSRHLLSLQRENDRAFYARKSNEAWAILEELLTDFDNIVLLRLGAHDYKLEPLFYRLATQVQLTDPPNSWERSVHPDDLHRLKSALNQAKDSAPFTLRLAQLSDDFVTLQVQVDHFEFMGKQLSVLRRLPSAAPAR